MAGRWRHAAVQTGVAAFAVAVLAGGVWLACSPPNDTLFQPTVIQPSQTLPGVYRVTFNTGPDIVRGFTADSKRIIYRSEGLAGVGGGWRLLSAPVAGGPVTEEASLYRSALRDPVGDLLVQANRRVLVAWQAALPGVTTCLNCPDGPGVVGLSILRLEPTDGAPLASLPTRYFQLPNNAAGSTCSHRIRYRPVDAGVGTGGPNPYGPAIAPGDSIGIFSDGETLWRFDLDHPNVPPDSLGPGAFPTLSADGSHLAAEVPTGVDSSGVQCATGQCPCVQQTVTVTAGGWRIVLYDLSGADTTHFLGKGQEPVFDPRADRLLVRRGGELRWIDLTTGAAIATVPNTTGARSIAISPDGALIAFSLDFNSEPDVFFTRVPGR